MKHDVPGFLSATITLRDAPTEPQTFYFCDVQALVDWIFGRIDLADCMEYQPYKLFDPVSGRLYSEMNTGDLWNEIHVSAV